LALITAEKKGNGAGRKALIGVTVVGESTGRGADFRKGRAPLSRSKGASFLDEKMDSVCRARAAAARPLDFSQGKGEREK